jgi:hypothetical protein
LVKSGLNEGNEFLGIGAFRYPGQAARSSRLGLLIIVVLLRFEVAQAFFMVYQDHAGEARKPAQFPLRAEVHLSDQFHGMGKGFVVGCQFF